MPVPANATTTIERRIRWAGLLIGIGLLVQLLSFIRIHPLSFIVFVVIGCPLVAAGILLYLHSLVSHDSQPSSP